MMRIPILSLVLVVSAPAQFTLSQQVTGQDIDSILQKADALLEEAKAAYELARSKSLVPAFVDAGFKLEEARIKYLVLQEVGSLEKQKIAAERLRAVNQLGKLVNDGKVAISGKAEKPSEAKPAVTPATPPPVVPAAPVIDVSKRKPIPEAAKQKEAELSVKELFKDQYTKKSRMDHKALARLLLDQASKSYDDPAALWVLYREASDQAVQGGDVKGAVDSVERAARFFDVDVLAMKSDALAALGKSASSPEEFEALTMVLDGLIDEFVQVDQYDAAEKAAAASIQHARKADDASSLTRATTRSKEVAEAKSIFKSLKGVMETLSRSSDDPGANLEMGKYLCYVKGNWDLGLRFLVKGADPALKVLAGKELALPVQSAERAALGDGWCDLSEKEKSPLRKSRLVAHAREVYESALPDATALVRARIEKRLAETEQADSGPINLLRMVDPAVDAVNGQWRMESNMLLCAATPLARLQIPYEPPDEYDLSMVVSRRSGKESIIVGLASGGNQFLVGIDAWASLGGRTGLELLDGKGSDGNPTTLKGRFIVGNQPHTIVCSVRKKGVTVAINSKKVIAWEGDLRRLTPSDAWRVRANNVLFVGCYEVDLQISRLILTPVSGQGKKLR